ncbi:LCP family protein [Candidatus Uhrbacteria bacterium]|nr:LCP family protein [Candidatus Uhrbacteria bacterium]
MEHSPINLIKKPTILPAYQTYRSPLPKILTACSIFFLLLGGTAVFSYQTAQDEGSALSQTWNALTSIPPLRGLAENANNDIVSDDGRVNVLLLGIGGGNHEGADLTDTIMLASIVPKTGRVAFFSIPRDLLIPIDGYGWRKINNANAFGETIQEGYGGEFARKTVEQVLGVSIPYFVRVDFQGFADIVDILGGIPITVDNSFTDYKYPTLDKKYQTISFDAGPQTMDGQRALMYVRSRHSLNNNEGSDFARSRRQQKIITAVKEKMFSTTLFFRPQKVGEILGTLKENISTNMEVWQLLAMGNALRKVDDRDIVSVVFDDDVNGLLVSEMIDGAYVLRPRDSSFGTLQAKVQRIFTEYPDDDMRTIGKDSTVIIRNGTTLDGIGNKTAALLKRYEFTVASVENARERTYQKTLVFDLSQGNKPLTKKFLADTLRGESIYDPYSPELDSVSGADFLIILGTDLPPSLAQTAQQSEIAPIQ